MAAPQLPWREPDFSYHGHGRSIERTASTYDRERTYLPNPDGTPSEYWYSAQPVTNSVDTSDFVNAVVRDINAGTDAYNTSKTVIDRMRNAGGGQPFKPDWARIVAETGASVSVGITAAEAGAIALGVGEALLVDYAMHEARNIMDPLMPGDNLEQKILNGLLMSVGITQTVGDYTPPNAFENALSAELELERYNVTHNGDSSLAANIERARLAALVAEQRAQRDNNATPTAKP